MRPRGEAVLEPRDNMITEGQTNGPWPNGAVPRWKGRVARGRAELAPPPGGQSGAFALWRKGRKRGEVAFFLGRARSARPRGKAGGMPRYGTITEG